MGELAPEALAPALPAGDLCVCSASLYEEHGMALSEALAAQPAGGGGGRRCAIADTVPAAAGLWCRRATWHAEDEPCAASWSSRAWPRRAPVPWRHRQRLPDWPATAALVTRPRWRKR
ncbi:MAG: hypothetical protein U1E17_04735 [Geminicoccaceae bacterium]